MIALVGDNQVAAFIREAVEAELRRREKRTEAPFRSQRRPAKQPVRNSGPDGED